MDMSPYEETLQKIRLRNEAKEKTKKLYTFAKEKEEENMKRRKVLRPLIAAAACAAVVFGAGVGGNVIPETFTNAPREIASKTFDVLVDAAPMEKGKAMAVSVNRKNNSWVFGGTEDGGVNYCIHSPFTCKGSGMKKITYEISKGAFQIIQSENGKDIVVDGKAYPGELNVGWIGGGEGEGEEISAKEGYYTSFSVSPDKQQDAYTWINICGDTKIKKEERMFGNRSASEEKDAINEMLSGVTITCTVTYQDNSTESATIVPSCELLKRKDFEGGWVDFEKEEGMDPEEKVACIVYTLQ